MRRKLRAWLPVMMLAAASVGCRIEEVPRPERVAVSDVAREDIRTTLEAYRLALLAGDATTIAEFFAGDARLYEPDTPDLTGPREIREAMGAFYASGRVLDVAIERESLDVAEGGVAFEVGTYSETFQQGEAAPQTVRGRYAIRWQRGPEATWRIHRFLVNRYPPADTAQPPGDAAATR